MAPSTERREIERLLKIADVTIDGTRDWDIQVHDEAFFARVLRAGSRGFGQAYVDGWWDCAQLDELFRRLLAARLDSAIHSVRMLLAGLHARLFNLQKPSRAFTIGSHHYDLGNDLYRVMLDRRMIYSSGYWANATSLDAAQEAKLDLVCRKLQLGPGMRVLDIGCGWGGLGLYLASVADVRVTGVTLAEEQLKVAQARAERMGLSDRVEFRLQDYREVEGTFDRVVSVGMLEHVGVGNLMTYFLDVRDRLAPDGVALIHSISSNTPPGVTGPFLRKYIFPGGYAPSLSEAFAAVERSGLWTLDTEIWRVHYAKTLAEWQRRFMERRAEVVAMYDERFARMWEVYLSSCKYAFTHGASCVFQAQLGRKRDAVPLTRDYLAEEVARLRAAESGRIEPLLASAGDCFNKQIAAQ